MYSATSDGEMDWCILGGRRLRPVRIEMLGTQSDNDVPALARSCCRLQLGAEREIKPLAVHPGRVGSGKFGGQEVHRWRSDEPGNESVRRVIVDVTRRTDLLNDFPCP